MSRRITDIMKAEETVPSEQKVRTLLNHMLGLPAKLLS